MGSINLPGASRDAGWPLTFEQLMSSPRRFPPPWTVEELDDCFVVRDHSGQQLAYVYFEDEPGRRSADKLLSKDEARRTVNMEKRNRLRN
jgi:hypothetical protein